MGKMKKIAIIGLSGESIFMKVDHFGVEGETVQANSFHIEYGGKGYNQAIAASRFGADVSFLTKFGKDEIAKNALKMLEKDNVKCIPVYDDSLPSAAATILIDKDGRNRVTCYQGASDSLTKEEVHLFEKEIKESEYLLLQLESSDESLFEAITIAEKYNTKIILNPAPAHKLPLDYLNKCDLITPNEQEVKVLFDLDKDIDIETLKHLPIKNMIVTLGEKGSLVKIDNNVTAIPPLKVTALNSTGAGDTYNGVLVASLLKGYDLIDAARLASTAASISVTREFVIDSIPYKEEIIKELVNLK